MYIVCFSNCDKHGFLTTVFVMSALPPFPRDFSKVLTTVVVLMHMLRGMPLAFSQHCSVVQTPPDSSGSDHGDGGAH